MVFFRKTNAGPIAKASHISKKIPASHMRDCQIRLHQLGYSLKSDRIFNQRSEYIKQIAMRFIS